MPKFFHSTNLKLDESYLKKPMSTSWDISRYWSSNLKRFIKANSYEKQLDLILDEYETLFKNLILDSTDIKSKIMDLREKNSWISSVISHGQYSSSLLKEYIFDEIKGIDFPNLPSRKKCMFLFSPEKDPEEYLTRMDLANGRHLIEISTIEGKSKIFSADYSILNCDLEDYKNVQEAATKYWQGISMDSETSEILFEGEYIIERFVPFGARGKMT